MTSKQLVIIDYGSGNLHSLAKALENSTNEPKNIKISNNANDIKQASHVILPGVGAFDDCIKNLRKINGLQDSLEEFAFIAKKPFLGVCVGMQMLADESHEHEITKGLGWIGGKVLPIPRINNTIKIPHMGWNNLEIISDHSIFKNITNKSHVYFVHSYKFDCNNLNNVLADVEHGIKITAAIAKDNLIGLQFHPEKSQKVGLDILRNFVNM